MSEAEIREYIDSMPAPVIERLMNIGTFHNQQALMWLFQCLTANYPDTEAEFRQLEQSAKDYLLEHAPMWILSRLPGRKAWE